MANRKDRLNDIFKEWESRNTIPGPFITDNLVDEQEWNSAHPRVMVLLKEANSTDGGWRYEDFIRDGGYLKEKSTTWPNLIRWTFGLLHPDVAFKQVERDMAQIKEYSREFFRRVYFANVKKVAGGASPDDRLIWKAADEGTDLLLRQVQVAEPNIVLCCGDIVFEVCKVALSKQEEEFEVQQTDGGLTYMWWNRMRTTFIRYHHPGAYIPKSMSYTYLVNEVQKIM